MNTPRFWTYTRDEYEPAHRWLPYIGGDEWGRRTLVLPVPFSGYLVWAWRTCRCEECDGSREQTDRWERRGWAIDASLEVETFAAQHGDLDAVTVKALVDHLRNVGDDRIAPVEPLNADIGGAA